mmetsp:Transcript_46339/g.134991  ORF Transcript_46339/g.134991 Transcript_46339/m.134991 type:complete len:269 (+) Transcript_46339:73-879(+)
MGGGASSKAQEESAYNDPDAMSVAGSKGETASDLAELLFGADESVSKTLTDEQQEQLSQVFALLAQPGWKTGAAKKGGVFPRYMFNQETRLYYACFHCDVPAPARDMFEDWNRGRAQERYSEVCSEEIILDEKERPFPLGPERLVRGIYKMPYPMQDRDFVWTEWSALLPTQDGGSLYISMAKSPKNENEVCPPEPERFTRADLKLSATFARQAPGSETCQMGFICQGDIKGKMPKALQNLLAGNASTYLAKFRDAHSVSVPETMQGG